MAPLIRAADPSELASSRGLLGLLTVVLREPLVHFIALGITIFAVGQHLEDRSKSTRITITEDLLRRLTRNHHLEFGEDPSPEQLRAMEDRWIEEEILYREAVKLGLDKNDEIVRRRLVQKYEFLQQDLAVPAEPTESQLIDYYRQHLDRYSEPPIITFSHVYFSPDIRGQEQARRASRELAMSLNRQQFSASADPGDRFPGDRYFIKVSRDQVARVFGQEGFTEKLFTTQLRQWVGPVQSGLGYHSVYVTDRVASRPIAFDQARETVRQNYIEAEQVRKNASRLSQLRQAFEIVRE